MLILELSSRHLIFHGTLLLLIALLYGAPYAKAIKSGAPAQVVNSWRVAHQSLFTIATPLAAITQDRGLISGSQGWARLVYWGNLVGAWTSLVAASSLVFAAAMSL